MAGKRPQEAQDAREARERAEHVRYSHTGQAVRWWPRPAAVGGGMVCGTCHPNPHTQEDQ